MTSGRRFRKPVTFIRRLARHHHEKRGPTPQTSDWHPLSGRTCAKCGSSTLGVCVCVSNHPKIACDSTCVMGGEEVKATRGTSIRFPLRSEYSSLCAMRGPRGRARRRPEGPKDSSVGLTKWLTVVEPVVKKVKIDGRCFDVSSRNKVMGGSKLAPKMLGLCESLLGKEGGGSQRWWQSRFPRPAHGPRIRPTSHRCRGLQGSNFLLSSEPSRVLHASG